MKSINSVNALALTTGTLLATIGIAASCGGGGGGGADAPPAGLCATYCAQMTANCTGATAQYTDEADCLSYCAEAAWPDGTEGEMSGNTLSCRIYHGGTPAMSNSTLHCPHAGPTGDTVCGSVGFRSDAVGTYTRVDAMGMPAVATALVGSAMKNAYNDGSPDSSTFAGEFVAQLTGIHAALDDDLAALNLAACDMTPQPDCVTQEVAAGVTVGDLVIPDQLKLDPGTPSGFPNGRDFDDPVIDVTLAVVLLDLGGVCGAGTCGAGTLAGLPLNPPVLDHVPVPGRSPPAVAGPDGDDLSAQLGSSVIPDEEPPWPNAGYGCTRPSPPR
jgi:hypothetical protein